MVLKKFQNYKKENNNKKKVIKITTGLSQATVIRHNFFFNLPDLLNQISSFDNKSVSHWIMFDYFFHV
jgi:hypothetical protein